nr:helix-turn-helix domain-containing protein [Burkholderiales bacterium]
MSLANKLKYLMAQLEVTANDIALNTNIERSTLTRILNGTTTRPQLETVYT